MNIEVADLITKLSVEGAERHDRLLRESAKAVEDFGHRGSTVKAGEGFFAGYLRGADELRLGKEIKRARKSKRR